MRSSSVNQVIIDVLSHSHTHLTAQQVYDQIVERLPSVNPSTVYRSLERMAKNGLVSISDMGTGAAVFETVGTGMHHHLVCQACGSVTTLSHAEVEDFFHSLGDRHGFRVATNHLVLFGICAQCQEAEQPSPG